jgi:site-specific DNA recombinase
MDTRNGAVTYSRVSTDGQVDGFSLDVQVRETKKAAEKLGCTVLKEFVEEGVSGTLEDRPELTAMLAFCVKNKDKVAYVIVKDIDRFSRQTLIHQILRSKFRELGVNLYSVNQPSISEDTPNARFMENIYSSVAQLERDQIRQRCESGTNEAVLHGAWTNRAPYGYDYAKTSDGLATLKIIPERAEAVVKAFQMYSEGALMTDICMTLNNLGYRTASGGKFSKQTMHNILTHIVYIGKIAPKQFPDQIIDGLHPAIISEVLWNAVQDRLNNRLPFPTRLKINPEFILTNILLCPTCAGPMAGGFHKGKSGKKYPYYHCRTRGCKGSALGRDKIHDEFNAAMERLEPTNECVKLFEDSIIRVWREKWQDACAEKSRLARRITELEEKRDAVVDKFITGKITEDLYQHHLQKVDDEILSVGQQRENHVLSEQEISQLLQFARRYITSPLNTWKNATLERRRVIQRLTFPFGLRPETNGTVYTLNLSPLMRVVDGSIKDESSMVAGAGFEPTTSRL